MYKLRLWTVLTIVWLSTFFMIERLHEPMNIASFVYVLAAVLAVSIVSLPRLAERGQMPVLLVAWGLLLILKPVLGYRVFGSSLPITVTEALALGVTVVLAGRLQLCLGQFREEALRLSRATSAQATFSFDDGQQQMYRELRRARHYERPLSLLAVSPHVNGDREALDQLVQEMQRASTLHYLRARVAEELLQATDGCATVAVRDDYCVVSLPEADLSQAREILGRMRAAVSQNLGIGLEAGVASFPEQELTLSGLLDRAETAMRGEGNGAPRDGAKTRARDIAGPSVPIRDRPPAGVASLAEMNAPRGERPNQVG